jgi:hypothetical protein
MREMSEKQGQQQIDDPIAVLSDEKEMIDR